MPVSPPTARQERREFVRAFAEHMWIRPDTDRPSIRPQTAVTLTALTALAALVFGVAWQLIAPPPKPVVQAPPPAGPAQTFTAVGGWDCPSAGDHGFEITGRTQQWRTIALGGWGRDGCHGTFQTMPMSGDAQAYDGQQAAVWWFQPGVPMTRCDVMVYVPAPVAAADSAARSARYLVLAGRGGSVFAEFTVDQAANQGQWIHAGSYPSGDKGIAIQLVNRGVPATPADRIAISQLKLACTS